MLQRTICCTLALLTAGCVRPAALTRGARDLGGHVTPAARAFAGSTRRIVRWASQSAEDAALAARVKAALGMRKGLAGCAIHVACQEGVVCLTGAALRPGQKRLAGEVVAGTVGVDAVRNRLRVTERP